MGNQSLEDVLQIARRNLPHWEVGGSVYFITWRSIRGALPEEALALVEKRIYAGHGKFFRLYAGVIMPDHVHLIIQPLPTGEYDRLLDHPRAIYYTLAQIVKGIKGASARDINLLLGTSGSVWQDERYDRIIRNENEYLEKYRYVLYNPVKAGLIEPWQEYRFYLSPPS
ncbi:MAG TPA: transposase [Candidatus Kapabacteria bacterium]|jgi:REP element-mobilizing transposase RayT|nr:transposase [Candidatus Kapabacteria bacterium]